jgi:hypothetical protein
VSEFEEYVVLCDQEVGSSRSGGFEEFLIVDPLRRVLCTLVFATMVVSCGDSDVVRATGKVEVYETYPKNEPGNKIVGTLSSGELVPVLATRHSKEFMFYRVKLADGREGYVMFGDDFKVEQKKQP